jgi:hypothetical protein
MVERVTEVGITFDGVSEDIREGDIWAETRGKKGRVLQGHLECPRQREQKV